MVLWTGFIWLRTGTSSLAYLQCANKPLGFTYEAGNTTPSRRATISYSIRTRFHILLLLSLLNKSANATAPTLESEEYNAFMITSETELPVSGLWNLKLHGPLWTPLWQHANEITMLYLHIASVCSITGYSLHYTNKSEGRWRNSLLPPTAVNSPNNKTVIP